MPFPLIPLIAAAIPAIVSGINAISNRRQTKATNEANLELARYQFQANQQAIESQNSYNSPEAQMARYSAAGLNPNLIYGSGSASAGNQASSAKYEAPRIDQRTAPIETPDMIGTYQNFEMLKAQIDNVKAQTLATRTKTATEAINQGLLGRKDTKEAFEQTVREGLLPYQFQVLENRTRQGALDLSKTYQNIQNLSKQEQIMELQRQYMQENLTTQQIDQERKRADLLFQKMRNNLKEIGVNDSDNIGWRLLARALMKAGIKP